MTRRISKKTGKAYTAGSESSWAGYPPEVRVCTVCGRRVTLQDSFRAHSEGGVKSVTHIDCLRAVRA